MKVDPEKNSKNSGVSKPKKVIAKGIVKVKANGLIIKRELWNYDPECEHELDPTCWSGIKCKKCAGWFCC